MWWSLACQEPFGTDRHDLVGFRVAAVSAPPAEAGATITPAVALIVEDRPWSDEPVDLAWGWVASAEEVLGATLDEAHGPAPTLTVPASDRVLALVATHQGVERRAFVELARPPAVTAAPTALTSGALPLELEALSGEELALEARQALVETPALSVAPGGFLRLRAEVAGDPLVRWMATGGTFFELDRQTADWAAGELRVDGDEIEDGRSTLDPGPFTFLALALGDPGEAWFRAEDRYVGEPPVGIWVQGRFLPADAAGAGPLRGTLRLDDTSPTGLSLAAVAPEPEPVVDWGTEALPCSAPVSGPFDPSWLLEGRCTRSEVEGASVVVLAAEAR